MPLFMYRAYVYNNLVERGYDVTVVSLDNLGNQLEIELHFKSRKKTYKKFGPFLYIRNFNEFNLKDFDIIIIDPNIRIINYIKILISTSFRHNLIAWGHMEGRSANNKLAQKARVYFLTRLRALIFYDKVTLNKFKKNGFDKRSLFLANNTQYVDNKDVNMAQDKKYFIFVGRLQERKRIDLLIKAYRIFKDKTKTNIKLKIVGEGDQLIYLKNLARNEKVIDSIDFTGKIINERKLKILFEGAVAYVSPGSVGLGVLHSFAFGIPVITCKTNIHGPEVNNCNESNSFIVDLDEKAIADKMCLLYNDKKLLKQMSINALNYYNDNCTLDNMVDGIENAIKFLNNDKTK